MTYVCRRCGEETTGFNHCGVENQRHWNNPYRRLKKGRGGKKKIVEGIKNKLKRKRKQSKKRKRKWTQ